MKSLIKELQKNKPGVYKIINTIDNKFYIGSTKDLSMRFRTHLYNLLKGNSESIKLQRAVIKHGIKNFEFHVIEVTNDYRELEFKLITELKPNYNLLFTMGSKTIISEETRKRMSDAQKEHYRKNPRNKGYKNPDYKRTKMNKVRLICNGEFLEFNSIKETAEHFNTSISAIHRAFQDNYKYLRKYRVQFFN